MSENRSYIFQRNKMCISMELVTAVLGDHGQRPQEDYGKRDMQTG